MLKFLRSAASVVTPLAHRAHSADTAMIRVAPQSDIAGTGPDEPLHYEASGQPASKFWPDTDVLMDEAEDVLSPIPLPLVRIIRPRGSTNSSLWYEL